MKKILFILFGVFIIIQFFPIDKTNPPVNKGMDFLTIKNTPPEVAQIIKTSCYDCHSNESKYPWYTNIQPVGWFVKNHIDEGRKELNFSGFALYEPKKAAHKLEECVEHVQEHEMPLDSYVVGHPDAKLSEAQRKVLIDYFTKIKEDVMAQNGLTEQDIKSKKHKE